MVFLQLVSCCDTLYSDQRKIQVIELEQHAIQLRLVAQGAGQCGLARWLVDDLQRGKPFPQRVAEMALHPNLVGKGLCTHAHSIRVNQGGCRLSKVTVGG